jgi:hypothetical protein
VFAQTRVGGEYRGFVDRCCPAGRKRSPKLAQFPNAQRRVRRIPIRDRAVLADLGDPIDRDTVRLNGALNERQKVQPNR